MKERTSLLIITAKLAILFILLMIIGCIPEEKATAPKALQPTLPKMSQAKPKGIKITTMDIKELDTALKAGVPVIVKLGSDKCIPCRAMNPIIKELAVEQDGKAVFLSLDVYENRELAQKAGVMVIPTILFYDKRGQPKAKNDGGMNKEQRLNAIEEMDLPAGKAGLNK